MIETREALDNLDDILATPGLDAVYIGPPTCRWPWAAPRFDQDEAPWLPPSTTS